MTTKEQIISARDAAIAEAQAKAERQLAELDGQDVGKCYRRNDCFWIIIGPIESGSLPFVSFNDIEISTGYLSSGLFEIDKTEIPRADFLAAYRKRMSAIHKAATGEELFGVEAVREAASAGTAPTDRHAYAQGHSPSAAAEMGEMFGRLTPQPAPEPVKDDADEVAAGFVREYSVDIIPFHMTRDSMVSTLAAIIRKAHAAGRVKGLEEAVELCENGIKAGKIPCFVSTDARNGWTECATSLRSAISARKGQPK